MLIYSVAARESASYVKFQTDVCPMCRHEIHFTQTEGVQLVRMENLGLSLSSLVSTIRELAKNDKEAFRKNYYLQNKDFETLGLVESGFGVENSMELALYWFTLASYQGSILAQGSIGKMIIERHVPGKSKNDALTLFHNAASKGSDFSQNKLGFHLYKDSEIAKALFWYKKAALQQRTIQSFKITE